MPVLREWVCGTTNTVDALEADQAETAILRRATLIALAGIPLVPIDTVVGSMIYAASRPSETESSSTGPR
jgi:hypothetical protein